MRAVAALPGEPHIVSAAGFAGEKPASTIENLLPFEADAKRRLVIVGGLDGDDRAAHAVVDAVRWFKTSASASIRERWQLSALPLGGSDNRQVRRWLTFQAPDVAIEVVATSDTLAGSLGPLIGSDDPLHSVRLVTTQPTTAVETMQRELASREVARSALHQTILNRISRDPLDIARVLARRYPQTPAVSYIAAVAWVNTLRLAALTGDDGLRAKVRDQTQPWVSRDKELFAAQIPLTAIAGTMIFADLAEAQGAGSARALAIEGATLASARKSSGAAEYGQGWTDDMFMASAILARTGRLTDRGRDLDVAARLLIDYAARLQRPDGIFVHATDGPFAWGRGNGFAALGLMEVLTSLPDRHRARAEVVDVYRRQMAAVRAMQAPDGAWRQVIDEPGAYREATATAMLLAAMARGIRLGWIDTTYLESVRRAWRALLAHIDEDGSLIDVCAGTGAGPTKQYYLDRPATTGFDDRGGAMALLASVEMYELSRPK